MSLKVTNLCSINTDDWIETSYSERRNPAIVPNRRYYIRCTGYYEGDSNALIMRLGGSNNESTPVLVNPESNTQITYSVIDSISGTTDNSLSCFFRRESEGSVVTQKFKHVICIDLTELDRDYPYFASLPERRQQALLDEIMLLNELPKQDIGASLLSDVGEKVSKLSFLDEALPYISAGETVIFDGVLENLVPNPRSSEEWKANSAVSDFVNDTENNKLTARFYGTPLSTGNNWVSKKITVLVEVKECTYVRAEGLYPLADATIGVNYNYLKDKYQGLLRQTSEVSGASSIVYGSNKTTETGTVVSLDCSKGVMCLNLSKSGAMLFFRLNGMTDEQIESYLNQIPFFEDTYSIGPAFLDKAGLQYYHGKVKTLLDDKADSSHTHTIDQITDLQTNLDGFKTPTEIVNGLFVPNMDIYSGYRIITNDDVINNTVTISLDSDQFTPMPTMLYIKGSDISNDKEIKKIILNISFVGDSENPLKNMKFVFKFKALGFCTNRRNTTIYSNVVKTAPFDFEYSGVVYDGGQTQKVIFEAGNSPAYGRVVGVRDIDILYGVSHYLAPV